MHYPDGQPKRISIEYKVGVDARDYSEVAKKEHLKPLELELRKLEDKAEEIHREMSYQRAREEKMRDTNGMYAFQILDHRCLILSISQRAPIPASCGLLCCQSLCSPHLGLGRSFTCAPSSSSDS